MRIGNIEFPNPFFMAPMAGVTDSIVRVLARRYDCGMVTTEMVASHVLAEIGAGACLGRMHYRPIEKPIAIQIFGSDERILAEAARRVEAHGADAVDINLGCSVDKIARVGGGAALCRKPAELGRILERTVAAVKVPVTVKIRKGWDDDHLNGFEILRIAEESGVAALAIHGRTSVQLYSGVADWAYIREMKQRARIPIIGNGDINTAQDAMRMLAETGCDAVMIGRACRGNPWIFQQCVQLWKTGQPAPAPGLTEKLRIVREHMELIEQKEGCDHQSAVSQIRKFLGWYTRGLPGSGEFRDRMFRISDMNEMTSMVEGFFAACAETRSAAA
jgi:nifR3 family TIM-barrel protein